jgi:hypothetical protein
MLRSCLIVMRGACLVPCAALRDDFGAVAWWSVEYWQVAWVWCAAGRGRTATVNRHGLRLVPSARLISGVPLSNEASFLADVLDGCCFLIRVWQNTPFGWFGGSDRPPFILVFPFCLLPLAGWQSWLAWFADSRLLELRKGRFAGETEIAGAREHCSDVERRTEQRRKLCSMWKSPHCDARPTKYPHDSSVVYLI